MKRCLLTLTCILAASTGKLAHAGVVTDLTWIGRDDGFWHVASNWDPQTIPDNSGDAFHAIINTKFGNLVNLGANATITNLTIGPDDHLLINNSRRLIFQVPFKGNSLINNAGVIEVGSTGSATYLQPDDGPLMLTGGGTLRMADSMGNYIYRSGAEGSLVNVDNVIEGAGYLGWSSIPTPITNQHLIIANATNPLIVTAGSAAFHNEGTMRADAGSTLRFSTGTYTNATGTIEAVGADALIELEGSSVLLGGILQSHSGGGFFINSSSSGYIDLIHDAHTLIGNSRTLNASGTIENTGLIELGSTGSSTYLRPTNGVLTLTGGGTVSMSNATTNYIYRSGVGSLVNVDNVIEGAGQLSWLSIPTAITNQHLIVANEETPLRINPGSELFTNQGTLLAEDGGVLELNTGTYDNIDGIIEAGAGSRVDLIGNTLIQGGLLASEDDGMFAVKSSGGHYDALDHDAHTEIENSRTLHLNGTINNMGTISLASTGSNTYLRPANGVVTLTGGGTVLMGDATTNRFYRDGNASLVNADNTIIGAGYIGYPSIPTGLVNNHHIIANGDNALRINPSNEGDAFINNSLLHAQGAGGVFIWGGDMDQKGTVTIDAGSSLTRQNGTYVQSEGVTTVLGTMSFTTLHLQGGLLDVAGPLTGDVNNTGGEISRHGGIGTISVDGDVAQSDDGQLVLVIDGNDPGVTNDLLAVTDDVVLGGNLVLDISPTFDPTPGTEVVLITADEITGRFDSYAPCDNTYQLSSDGSTVIATFGGQLIGDFNCDSRVNVSDMLVLLGAWGSCPQGELCPADLNGDGSVNVSDLLQLLSNWG